MKKWREIKKFPKNDRSGFSACVFNVEIKIQRSRMAEFKTKIDEIIKRAETPYLVTPPKERRFD